MSRGFRHGVYARPYSIPPWLLISTTQLLTTSLGEELFSIILYQSFTDTMLTHHLLDRSTNKWTIFTASLLDILWCGDVRNLLNIEAVGLGRFCELIRNEPQPELTTEEYGQRPPTSGLLCCWAWLQQRNQRGDRCPTESKRSKPTVITTRTRPPPK